MKIHRHGLMLGMLALALLPGCRSLSGESPSLIPNKALGVSRSVSLPLESLALAAGVFVIVDPLAPNWRIEEQQLAGERYSFALTKKRFTTGGDGEAMPVLRRRLEQLVQERGYARYDIVSYSEGIESGMPIAQRVSKAVVQFAGSPVAKASTVR